MAPNTGLTRVHVGSRGLVPLWRQPIVSLGLGRKVFDQLGAPAISLRHRIVIVGTAEGHVEALSLDDGHVVWRRRYPAPFAGAALIVDGIKGHPKLVKGRIKTGHNVASHASYPVEEDAPEWALLGAQDGTLMAWDVLSGTELWATKLDGDVRAWPSIAGNHAVVATSKNSVVALDINHGEIYWTQSHGAPTGLSVRGHARPLIAQGRVFVTYSDGVADSFDLATGTLMWSRSLSSTRLRAIDFADADADLIAIDGLIVAASMTDGVFALSADDGSTVWQAPVLRATSLLAHASHVVTATTQDGKVIGLAADTGRILTTTSLGSMPISNAVIAGQTLVVTSSDAGLVALNDTSHRPLAAAPIGGRAGEALAAAQNYVAMVLPQGFVMVWQILLPAEP